MVAKDGADGKKMRSEQGRKTWTTILHSLLGFSEDVFAK
jgi:hypothetical protein